MCVCVFDDRVESVHSSRLREYNIVRINTHTHQHRHIAHIRYNSTTRSCVLACARSCVCLCVCISCTHSKAEISCLQFNLATAACAERERVYRRENAHTHTYIRCFVCLWNDLRPPTLRDCGLRVCVCVCNFRVTTTATNTQQHAENSRCHALYIYTKGGMRR